MDFLLAYLSFRGRLNRGDYAIILLSGYIIPLAMFLYLYRTEDTELITAIEYLLIVIMLWVFFAATARRFHDIDKPGWACLAVFVPIVGIFTPFVLLFIPGSPLGNSYGKPQAFFFDGRRRSPLA